MGRTGLFHLYLHLAVSGIDVVELLFPRGTEVAFFLGVQVFVQMEYAAFAAQEEAQGIKAGILIVAFAVAGGIFVQQRRAQQPDAAEVEIVAQGAFLVVDDGMRLALAALNGIAVAINHGGTRAVGHGYEAFQGRGTEGHGSGFQHQQHVVGLGTLGDMHHQLTALQRPILQQGNTPDGRAAQ